jgi:hypothetical protein
MPSALHQPALSRSSPLLRRVSVPHRSRANAVAAAGSILRAGVSNSPTRCAAGASRLRRSIPSTEIKEAEANQGASQVEQPPEQVGTPLIADSKVAATEQPGAAALHYPAVSPQPFVRFDPAAGDARGDATCEQGTPKR